MCTEYYLSLHEMHSNDDLIKRDLFQNEAAITTEKEVSMLRFHSFFLF